MFILTMETENFSWLAAGETEEEAREALRFGWAKHIIQYGHNDGGMPANQIEKAYEPMVMEILPGQCVRDHDVISTVPA